jgi:hypothetical protein
MDNAFVPDPVPAVRLIFEYDGDDVRLVSQQPVDVAVPGVDLARELFPGHYVETRDANNAPLARVAAREAFSTSAEVFPEQHGDPITRVDVEKPQGAFTVVVPAGTAAQVALLHVQAPAAVQGALAGPPEVVELATFPLEASHEHR